jgi:tryptophan 2,3-dioxygenase
MTTPTAINYWDYLRLDQLLGLQGGLEGDEAVLMPDELTFIIVHQAYELWFKLILRELRLARDHLALPELPEVGVPHVVHHLRRVNQILQLLVQQFAVVETLTPQDFLAFRDKLVPASGFQSFQMRELEIVLGLPASRRESYGKVEPLAHIRALAAQSPTGAMAWGRVAAAQQEVSLRAALEAWLGRTPIQGSQPGAEGDAEVVADFVDAYLREIEVVHADQCARLVGAQGTDPEQVAARFALANEAAARFLRALDVEDADARPAVQRRRAGLVFVESYRDLPLLAWPRLLVDTVVELEEQMVLWRHRHARMVERVIGRRVGTGGSSGVDYLDKTTAIRIFDELWTVRTMLLPKDRRPPLRRAETYGFAT